MNVYIFMPTEFLNSA